MHGGIGLALDVSESFPVRMIESGPAAGAIAAAHFARTAMDIPDAIAFDMGGTTAKISVIRNGEPTVTNAFEVGHVHRFKRGSGLPLQITAIELLEIGAGGGSIARVDKLRQIRVGPDSAGSDPGPVAYQSGGTQPSVTDANLVLGKIDPDTFAGGRITLDGAAAMQWALNAWSRTVTINGSPLRNTAISERGSGDGCAVSFLYFILRFRKSVQTNVPS